METATLETPQDALLSAREVAAWLGVSKAYVYELAQPWQPADVRLASVRIGRVVRFRTQDVAAYIVDHAA